MELSGSSHLVTINDDSTFQEQDSEESEPDLGAYDYEAETNRIVEKSTTKSAASSRRAAFKKAQTVDNLSLRNDPGTKNLIKRLIKNESKKKPSMLSNGNFGQGKLKMGVVVLFDQVLPVKQRYDIARINVFNAISIIQKWCRKLQLRVRSKKAIARLNKFVKGYYFDKCRQLFYADLFRVDEKKVEQLERQEKREQYLTKLRPMRNRMLHFKDRTFKIDTLSRDV